MNRFMDKQMVVYPYNEIVLGNKKEWAVDSRSKWMISKPLRGGSHSKKRIHHMIPSI